MSVSGRKGGVAIGIQTNKTTVATVFTSFALVSSQIDTDENVQALPPELGGVALTRGMYKAGYVVAGTVKGVVRLTDVGILLYAMCGNAAVAAGSPVVGANTHTLKMAADQFSVPWLTIRRSVDGTAESDQYLGCKAVALRLMLPGQGILMFEMSFIGREATTVASTVAVPSDDNFGVSCLGSVLIPADGSDTTKKFLAADIRMQNQVTTPETEQNIGSYIMDDIQVLGRKIGVNLTYKWDNRTFYKQLAGLGTGAWTSTLFQSSLLVSAASPNFVTGTTPYSLEFVSASANSVLTHKPVGIEGSSIVVMGVTGEIVHATGDPFTVTLVNGRATAYSA